MYFCSNDACHTVYSWELFPASHGQKGALLKSWYICIVTRGLLHFVLSSTGLTICAHMGLSAATEKANNIQARGVLSALGQPYNACSTGRSDLLPIRAHWEDDLYLRLELWHGNLKFLVHLYNGSRCFDLGYRIGLTHNYASSYIEKD